MRRPLPLVVRAGSGSPASVASRRTVASGAVNVVAGPEVNIRRSAPPGTVGRPAVRVACGPYAERRGPVLDAGAGAASSGLSLGAARRARRSGPSERQRLTVAGAARARRCRPASPSVLAVLRSSAVVLDAADGVVKASPAAYAFGLVRGHDAGARRAARPGRRGPPRRRDPRAASSSWPAARSAGPRIVVQRPRRAARRATTSCCWSRTAPRPAGSRRCAATSSRTSATS